MSHSYVEVIARSQEILCGDRKINLDGRIVHLKKGIPHHDDITPVHNHRVGASDIKHEFPHLVHPCKGVVNHIDDQGKSRFILMLDLVSAHDPLSAAQTLTNVSTNLQLQTTPMSDLAHKFHELWLGMCQPSEGLVVSVPVLVDAQCMEKQDREVQQKLLACTALDSDGNRYVPNVQQLLSEVLGLTEDLFDAGDTLPQPLRLYVAEGKQNLRPTLALKRKKGAAEPPKEEADPSAAAQAGRDYLALVWDVPTEVDLDKPETLTGPWEYPAQAKMDRLLRECRVPLGILTNGRELRLTYAPHGESSGWLSFRVDAMCEVGGRSILDAFVMLLGRTRLFGVAEDVQLPALLAQSRGKQGEVTNALSGQLFEALEELLGGFSAASERDKLDLLRRALEDEEEGTLYSGLLTVLLRLVFALYCEDRGLLPVESELFAKNYSVFGLYDELEKDHGRFPDSMDRRYGAYPRLVSLFRAMYLGVSHGDLHLPPRHGGLFDPNAYPFLEGWGGGSAPIRDAEARAAVDLPAISDGTIYRVLKKLIMLGGQRLSYRALDVEQIGSVYEALMGFDVERLTEGAVRIKLASKKSAARVWVEAAPLLAVPAARREKWLQDELGFDKGVAAKVAAALKSAKTAEDALTALEPLSAAGKKGAAGNKGRERKRVPAGTLVIQPGPERRRTSSHYTPRSLSEPIVRKTLDPLIRCMGERPSSEAILSLKVCDPAMGSGAFLVAACRYLADHVVAAWTREAAEETAPLKGIGEAPGGGAKTKLEILNDAHEDVVNHARRLVAQRCLYGVDKNKYAVQLARLSLWLVTMAKNEPFTFVDHSLRYGDSLVGLNFEQIRAFHWKAGHKGEQIDGTSMALQEALDEAIGIRQQILDLAADPRPAAQLEKARLLADSEDAIRRARLIADLVVGAFFAEAKDKDREKERVRRLDIVQRWLAAIASGDSSLELELQDQLRALQAELAETQVPFHWHLEFPEVFYLERPDPLDGGKVNGAAMMDAFVGNPPFMGKNGISEGGGVLYLPFLQAVHEGAHGNADLSAHFFRRAAALTGAHGTIGLIATNTIGQGDTRATGLQHLCSHAFSIFSTTVDMPWPGDAGVTVSVAHLAKGTPARLAPVDLNGRKVNVLNSRLRPKPERPDPSKLSSNADRSYQGSIILGIGFILTPEEREELVGKAPNNAERIFPYLGGEEVNSSPTQSPHRHVISFGQMDLDEAETWPDLISIVREKVKPERDKNKREVRRKYWWRFGEVAPALYSAIASLDRCLVIPQQYPNYVRLAFQPTDRILSQKLIVLPFSGLSEFAALSSSLHNAWSTLLGGKMGSANTAVYSPSDCFETFPFPQEDPRTVIPELEAIGEQLYEARAKYMVDTDQGLTKTYNALKDPHCTDERIVALRALHEEMDRAVLRAYPRLPGVGQSAGSKLPGVGSKDPDVVGWSDIPVPPFCISTDEDKALLQAFEDEVIDRLFVLNADRAKKEAALGRGAKKGGKKKAAGTRKTAASSGTNAAASAGGAEADASGVAASGADAPQKKKAPKKGVPPEGQGSLF